MNNTKQATSNEEQINNDPLYRLRQPIPKEYLITYTEDGKTFTGYKAQYAINLLNKNLGEGGWLTEEEIRKEEYINNGWAVAMKLILMLKMTGTIYVPIIVTGYGGSHAKNIANAYKGAKTSAFKNACRYLGIGQELYLGDTSGEEDIVYEPITEQEISSEQPQKPEKIAQGDDLYNKVMKATNLEQLESLKDVVMAFDGGQNAQETLIKIYNTKKIELKEKK